MSHRKVQPHVSITEAACLPNPERRDTDGGTASDPISTVSSSSRQTKWMSHQYHAYCKNVVTECGLSGSVLARSKPSEIRDDVAYLPLR